MDVVEQALRRGFIKEVKSAIINGYDVNRRELFSMASLLHTSAGMNNLDMTNFLIEAGAYVHAVDNDYCTPLHYGAFGGNVDIVKRLIAAGADVNAEDKDRKTPLFFSLKFGREDTVKALIAAGAEVNAKDKDRMTPLHCASQHGHKDTVKLLIVAGIADLNAKDKFGSTPLHVAAKCDHVDTVKALIMDVADTTVEDGQGKTSCEVSKNHKMKEAIIKYTVLYQSASTLKNKLQKKNWVLYRKWNECEEEVKKLKETFLGESCMSFFTFITETDQNKLALYSSTENLVINKKIAGVSCCVKFPTYAEDIEAQFEKGSERANLLHKSQESLIQCFCNTLPPEIVRKICEYMTNHDLKNFLG